MQDAVIQNEFVVAGESVEDAGQTKRYRSSIRVRRYCTINYVKPQSHNSSSSFLCIVGFVGLGAILDHGSSRLNRIS